MLAREGRAPDEKSGAADLDDAAQRHGPTSDLCGADEAAVRAVEIGGKDFPRAQPKLKMTPRHGRVAEPHIRQLPLADHDGPRGQDEGESKIWAFDHADGDPHLRVSGGGTRRLWMDC